MTAPRSLRDPDYSWQPKGGRRRVRHGERSFLIEILGAENYDVYMNNWIYHHDSLAELAEKIMLIMLFVPPHA